MKLHFKLMTIVFCSIFMNSCKAYRQYKNQEYQYFETSQNFKLIKDMMIVSTKIEDQSYPFIFDTGASVTVLTDTTVLKDSQNRTLSTFGKATMPDGGIKKNEALTINDFDTEIFKAKNKMALLLSANKPKCDTFRYRGLIGTDVFWNLGVNQRVLLDFDDNFIAIKNRENVERKLSADGYQRVKADFKNYTISLRLKIGAEEYMALFDTGFNGFFVLPNAVPSYQKSFSLIGAYFSTANSKLKGQTDFYENIAFEMGDMEINGTLIVSNNAVNDNIVGMGFIKNFNWIIDYENQILYAKKNSRLSKHLFNDINENYVDIVEEKLNIVTIKDGFSKYKLGSEIVSVKHKDVVVEGLCEIKQLLNSTTDWESLKVIVK